ncbi:MAG: hypothetical protein IPO21_20275 [Bacteroidales bacterium]|nr:hypothetical protein [Bacteroidales bacterium]
MIHRLILLSILLFATVKLINAQCAVNTGLTHLSITNSKQFANAAAGDTYYWSFDGVKGNIYVFSTCNSNNDAVHTKLEITDYEYKLFAADSGNALGCSATKAYIEWECPADDIYYLDITEIGCAPLSSSVKLSYQVKETSPVMYTYNQFSPHVGEANYLVNFIEINTDMLTTSEFLLQNLKFDFSKISNKSNISELSLYVATVDESFAVTGLTLLTKILTPLLLL